MSEEKDESWIKRHARSLFILAFQITPVIRYFYCLKYALKARKCKKEGDKVGQRRHYILMLREDQDVALIRVFECFMEAAPQQILQITIMIMHHNIGFNFHCNVQHNRFWQLEKKVGRACKSAAANQIKNRTLLKNRLSNQIHSIVHKNNIMYSTGFSNVYTNIKVFL